MVAVDTTRQTKSIDWRIDIPQVLSGQVLSDTFLLLGTMKGELFTVNTVDGTKNLLMKLDANQVIDSMVVVNERKVVIAAANSLIWFDPETRQTMQALPVADAISSIVHIPDTHSYVAATRDGTFYRFVENADGRLEYHSQWANAGDRVYQVLTAPQQLAAINKEQVLSLDHSGALLRWDVDTVRHISIEASPSDPHRSVALLPIQPKQSWPTVAIGCDQGLYLLDLETSKRQVVDQQTREINAIHHWPNRLTLLESYSDTSVACSMIEKANRLALVIAASR